MVSIAVMLMGITFRTVQGGILILCSMHIHVCMMWYQILLACCLGGPGIRGNGQTACAESGERKPGDSHDQQGYQNVVS